MPQKNKTGQCSNFCELHQHVLPTAFLINISVKKYIEKACSSKQRLQLCGFYRAAVQTQLEVWSWDGCQTQHSFFVNARHITYFFLYFSCLLIGARYICNIWNPMWIAEFSTVLTSGKIIFLHTCTEFPVHTSRVPKLLLPRTPLIKPDMKLELSISSVSLPIWFLLSFSGSASLSLNLHSSRSTWGRWAPASERLCGASFFHELVLNTLYQAQWEHIFSWIEYRRFILPVFRHVVQWHIPWKDKKLSSVLHKVQEIFSVFLTYVFDFGKKRGWRGGMLEITENFLSNLVSWSLE